MQTLESIRLDAHDDLLSARQFDRAVGSADFEDAYARATGDELVLLSVILKSKDTDQLKQWIRSRLYTVLEDMPYGRLRELASQEQIPKYSRMSKSELILALTAKHATSLGKRSNATERNAAAPAGSGDSGTASGNAERPVA